MTNPTQHSWAFSVGDGADPQVFTQIEGMYEVPEFDDKQLTTRDRSTISHMQNSRTKKKVFNRDVEGQEITFTLDYLPGDSTQDRLYALYGDNDGGTFQFQFFGEDKTILHEFNALVTGWKIQGSASTDAEAYDQVSVTLMQNADAVRTETPVP